MPFVNRTACLALLACLVARSVSAEISLRLSNQQLAHESSVVLIGRATTAESRWIDRRLVTAVTIEIAESLKGDVSGTTEVLLPGGIDVFGRIQVAMTYPGAPQIQHGEEVFLFLTYDQDLSGYTVSGFAQGKFSIVTQRGKRLVSRDLRGSQLVEGTGLSRGTVTLTPLAEFRAEIDRYVRR